MKKSSSNKYLKVKWCGGREKKNEVFMQSIKMCVIVKMKFDQLPELLSIDIEMSC